MRDVAVIGIGMNKWGELWEKSLRDVFVEAALKAIDDAGVDKIDSMYIGCMTSGLFVGQEHLASLMSDYLGHGPIPACRVESACASGGLAVRQGFIDVASGMNDIVLVGGVEKMNDIDGGGATAALATASDQEWEAFSGITFPGVYALMAHAHMQKYGTTRNQISQVAVKNHENGLKNPNAQYHMKLTVDMVNNAAKIADPLTLFDCSPITDGAAALIMCPVDMAKKISKKPIVRIKGAGHATDTIALHSRKDLTTINSATLAAQKAYKMADISPTDVNFAEVHDCFTISELILSESLGFVERGDGGKAAEKGETALTGRIPINTSGGLKSKGHPVGATGVAQAYEAVTQLRGDGADRQLKNPKIGLTQNMGGSGGSSIVHVWEVL